MPDKFQIPPGVLEWGHFSEPLKQFIRRLVTNKAIRTIIGEAAAKRFTQLTDTFTSYTGHDGKLLGVNAAADGVEATRVTTDHADAQVVIPWIDGDTKATLAVGSEDEDNDQHAIIGRSYDGVGVGGYSENFVGVVGDSITGTGVDGSSATGIAGQFRVTDASGPLPTVRIDGAQTAAPDLSVEGAHVFDPNRTAIAGNLTLSGRHHYVEVSTVSAARTVTLPTRAAWNDGILYVIYDAGRNSATVGRNITLNTDGTDQFADAAVTTLALSTSGATWHVRGVRSDNGTRKWGIARLNEGK